MSGIDPNDVQCCSGGLDPNEVSIWSHGAFHTIGCPTLQEGFFDQPAKKAKLCECGAASTRNTNCHATWCPEYVK